MVGVPGRSKGCHTCRKRRIKCDEGKPICHRCRKAGYVCTGYERPLLFRNASTAPFPIKETLAEGVPNASRGSLLTLVVPERSSSDIPQELSLIAFEDTMCFAFLFDNFVWRTYGTPWLEMAAEGKLGQLPLDASQALSRTNFGRKHHHQDNKLKGAIQYSKALKTLAPQLSDTRRQGVEALIVPILILMIHASSEADLHGSYFHMRGVTQLLYVCGPQRFQYEPLRSAFESCRASLTIAHLIIRQRCFLEDENWRTLPWALDPLSQSFQSKLLNVLVTIPGFLADDTRLDNQFDFESQTDLLQRIEFQLENLFKLRWQWEEDNPFAAWEEDAGRDMPPSSEPLYFTTVAQANEITIYNAVLLWLIGLLWKLDPLHINLTVTEAADRAKRSISSTHPGAVSLLLPGETIQLRDIAIELFRAFDFEIKNLKNNFLSSLFILMPVGLAWSVLEKETTWREAITESLASSHITKGYIIGGNVYGFGFYSCPKIPESEPATLWLSHSIKTTWTLKDDELSERSL